MNHEEDALIHLEVHLNRRVLYFMKFVTLVYEILWNFIEIMLISSDKRLFQNIKGILEYWFIYTDATSWDSTGPQ